MELHVSCHPDWAFSSSISFTAAMNRGGGTSSAGRLLVERLLASPSSNWLRLFVFAMCSGHPVVSLGGKDFISLVKRISVIICFQWLNQLWTTAWGLEQWVSCQTSSGLCGVWRRSNNKVLGPCSDTLLSVRSDMHKWHVPPHWK